MPSRSQRHLREVRGVDSDGDKFFPGYGPAPNFTAVVNLGAKTVTIAGGPAVYPRTVRVTYRINGVANDIHVYTSVLIGDTFGAIAAKIAVAINAAGNFTAAAVGGVVTLTFAQATTIQALSVFIL